MNATYYNDYYIALIIISIITIAIGIALSFYFIFVPATRIETEIDNLETRGLETLSNLNRLVNTTTQLSDDVLQGTCDSIIYIVNKLFGAPLSTTPPETGCLFAVECILCNPLVPSVCAPYLPDDPGCSC